MSVFLLLTLDTTTNGTSMYEGKYIVLYNNGTKFTILDNENIESLDEFFRLIAEPSDIISPISALFERGAKIQPLTGWAYNIKNWSH